MLFSLKVNVLVIQSCPILCNPMDCSLPLSSVHGFLQARILEWVANPFSRGFSWPRDWTQVSHIADRFLTVWATREVLGILKCVASVLLQGSSPPRGQTCISYIYLHWQVGSLPLVPPGSPIVYVNYLYCVFFFTFLSLIWRLSKRSDFLSHFISFCIC